MAGRRGRRPARGSSGLPLGLAFVSGLAVGLSVALVGYLHSARPSPGEDATPAADGGQSAPAPRPKFDFYTILPEMEIKVPEWRLQRDQAAPAPELPPGRYVIQVGSFRKLADADRVKAELALQGIEAGIERVVIEGQDVWYRVRVGPFTDRARLAAVRQRLTAAGMEHLVLRLKG